MILCSLKESYIIEEQPLTGIQLIIERSPAANGLITRLSSLGRVHLSSGVGCPSLFVMWMYP